MRQAFIDSLEKQASLNKNILFLTGDLGFTVVERYRALFPDKFFNMGVAEANMMGVAAGLALSGKIPFVYSIAPFVCLRPYEQIRNDICMHKANVKIIGIGGGVSYTHAGPSHHIIEDLSVMRTLPNMTVICPSDPSEVKSAVSEIVKYEGPIYLRIGKKGEPIIHKKKIDFKIGRGILIKEGNKVAVISCGPITNNVIRAAKLLEKKGINLTIVSMHTIKPLDYKLIEDVIHKHKIIFSVEEHSIIGGLGSAVGEYIAENTKKKITFRRFGLPDSFCETVGDYDYLYTYYGLSAGQIANKIYSIYSKLQNNG